MPRALEPDAYVTTITISMAKAPKRPLTLLKSTDLVVPSMFPNLSWDLSLERIR